MTRIAIIGAGPIGLEAALLARQLGHDVQVFEKGLVGESLLEWGHVRLFTPFGMNSSEWGRGAIARSFGADAVPRDDELLTGRQFAAYYLQRLAQLPELAGCLQTHSAVLSITRRHFRKPDGIGSAARAAQPFQLLIQKQVPTTPRKLQQQICRTDDVAETDDETELILRMGQRWEYADVVMDCSGTYPNHNGLASGGGPCLGEKEYLNEISFRLRKIDPQKHGGKRTLVVGSGFSAATSVIALDELARQHPRTEVLWIANSLPGALPTVGPLERVPNDPLRERDQLAVRANELAVLGRIESGRRPKSQRPTVTWLADASISRASLTEDDKQLVFELDWSRATGQGGQLPTQLTVDRLIANVGYRPNRSIYEELHVHECYATQGPIKLAAKLLGETSTDCLSQSSHGGDVLKNPEPNFFILGSKSYGRNSQFLLRVGLEQVREVLSSFRSRP
ncbi:MAG: NAD(P)-binding domain-containing protein [Planctomycetaceae bacterium]